MPITSEELLKVINTLFASAEEFGQAMARLKLFADLRALETVIQVERDKAAAGQQATEARIQALMQQAAEIEDKIKAGVQ